MRLGWLKNPFVVGIAVWICLTVVLSPFLGERRCNDGWRSSSIGKSGACSWHGGVGARDGWCVYFASIAGGALAGLWIFGANESQNRSNRNLRFKAPSPRRSPKFRSYVEEQAHLRCPKCRSRMKLRVALKGSNPGQKFFGCSRYPVCTGSRGFK